MTRARTHPSAHLALDEATYCAIDTETTGMDPRRDQVVALGAVRFRPGGEILDRLEIVVDPGIPIPPASTRVHGIGQREVRGAPALAEALPKFRALIADAVPVAHMGAFDLAFLRQPLRRAGLPSIERMLDTAVLASRLAGPLPDLSLEALGAYFGVPLDRRHTASGDAAIAAAIFTRLLPALRAKGVRTLGQALDWGDVTRAPVP